MSEIQQIPIDVDAPSFKIRTELEGTQFILRFDWNVRSERWHISIFDADEVPLLEGMPMNINTELIGRYEIPGLPLGQIMLFDESGKQREAGRDDLINGNASVYYNTSE